MNSIYYNPNLQSEQKNRRWFKNLKLVGEVEEGTNIYIEDYAYTYLHQYAKKNITYELCAVLLGENNKECNQVIIYGVIPIEKQWLDEDTKWIDESVLDLVEEQRQQFFPEGQYVGWMHTQPGYGIMTTSQEMMTHKEIFGEDCILMLIDPIYSGEAFFTCENNEFIEKKGFCMYYEKNEHMQTYMENYPIIVQKPEHKKDQVAGEFRELGARRKREVERKKQRQKIVSIAVAGIALSILFITGIYSQQKKLNKLEQDISDIHQLYSDMEEKIDNNPVELIFRSSE